jgi:hypothetical protein
MNKLLLAAVLGLVPLLCFGQGTSVRSFNGVATNLTFYGGITNPIIVYMGNSALGSTFSLIDTNGLNRIAIAGVTMTFRDTNVIRLRITGNSDMKFYDELGNLQIGINTNGMYGNGYGLTNLAAADFPAGPTYVYQGKVTFVSNVVFNVIDYTTNSHPSSGNIDLSKSFAAFATNNNTTFSGLANKNAGATNVQLTSLFITNSSASAKTITMDASFQRMGSLEGNTLYVTNIGQLLVFHYPGFGTNYYFRSR